jgi:hypothetical protein
MRNALVSLTNIVFFYKQYQYTVYKLQNQNLVSQRLACNYECLPMLFCGTHPEAIVLPISFQY